MIDHDHGETYALYFGRFTDIIVPPPLPPGEIGLLGQLALTFLGAGAATALINCLRAYIERDHTLRFRLKRADGVELEIESKDLSPDHLVKTLQDLEKHVG
jgi:hypothetical protein